MPRAAKYYAYSVIAVGASILTWSLSHWSPNLNVAFGIYFALSIVASMLKFKLAGIEGTYSPSFLFTLIGIAELRLPETLVATCTGALIQCVWKAKHRPSPVSVLFSVANLTITTSLCFVMAHSILAHGLQAYRPAVLSLVAAIHFATSTVLVSGVLALLEGRRLRAVYEQCYFWSFPYYLVGAAVVGLLPLPGQTATAESWLILLPLLYLVHFYYVLSSDAAPAETATNEKSDMPLSARATVYIYGVILAGAALLGYATLDWQSENLSRFAGYMAMALLAGTYKVRLPRLRSTVSVSFVLILVAISELHYAEAIWLSAVVAIMQSVWRARRRPKAIRIAFNCASLVLSTSLAYFVCRTVLGAGWFDFLPAFLVTATAMLYVSNSAMVAAAMCLAERKPM